MMVSGYSMDLYCDMKNPEHGYREFPHQFFGESGGECRKAARRKGWIIETRTRKAFCPKCHKQYLENRYMRLPIDTFPTPGVT